MTGNLKLIKKYFPDLLVIVLLFAATLSLYIQAVHFGFVQPEDEIHYAEARARLGAGGSPIPESLRMPSSALYWVPVSNFLLFIDVYWCGDNIGMLHLINLLFHATSCVLLYLILRLTTGAIRPSAFAAALFGLHPINTEAVVSWCWGATLAEGLLFLITFLLYIHYARRPSTGRYLPVAGCFFLTLLARPSVLYLPALLLLFDFWPLSRWRPGGGSPENGRFAVGTLGKLILEKVPLLVIAAVWMSLILYAIHLMPAFPLLGASSVKSNWYLFNIPVAYVLFLWSTAAPFNMPSYFLDPLNSPFMVPLWQVITASLALLLISAAVAKKAGRHPFLVTGWCWFLISLFPSAFACVRVQKIIMERLGYLPMIGIFIIVAWGGSLLLRKVRCPGRLSAVAAVLILAALSIITWSQSRHWTDRVSYFRHAVALHPDSEKAHSVLGEVLNRAGRIDEAMAQYETALGINPDYPVAHNHLAMILLQRGETQMALDHLRQAVRSGPDYVQARNNLANLLADLGDLDGAIYHFGEALRTDPKLFQVHNNLATVLLKKGDYEQAVSHFQMALKINPGYKTARENLEKVRQMRSEP